MFCNGWHGVQDHLHMLLAVSYEQGMLACQFYTGEPIIHVGVPENIYRILLRTPYAGSYYRKYVKGKYPCPYETKAKPYRPREKPNPKPRPEAPIVDAPQMDLFGLAISGSLAKSLRNL